MPYIYGQLLNAQMENSAGNPASGGTPTGRFYIDVTNAANAVPKFFNGTSWLPLLAQSTLFTQTTTSAQTVVNWANGLYQQVILGAHTVISFSNPIPGQTHVLVISQIGTEVVPTTPWMYTFSMPDQDCRRQIYLPQGVMQSSVNQLFAWYYQSAIKPAYTQIPGQFGAPAVLPSTLMTGIVTHPKLNIVYGGRTTTPFATWIPFNDDGAKFRWGNAGSFVGTATAFAAQAVGVDISQDGDILAVASGTTPFLQCTFLDPTGMFSTANSVFSNPAILPAGAGQCLAIHPSASHVTIGHTTTPFMSTYPINVGTYGLRQVPSTLPAAQVNAVAWSPVGDFLFAAGQTTPFLQAWPFDPFNNFGTIVPVMASLPAGGPPGALGKGLAVHPSGAYVAMAMNASPFVTVYPFSRAGGGSWSTPIVPSGGNIPNGTPNCVAWSPDGNYLYVGTSGGNFLYVYDFSSQILGTPVTFISSNPTVQVNDITFSRNGEFLFLAVNSSPFIICYPTVRKARNYLKLDW